VPTKSQSLQPQKCNADALYVLHSPHPASTYRSSTPPPLVVDPHSSSHHMKMWRWCLSRCSPHSPSSQDPHQLTTSCLCRQSRHLRPPRRRNSCGVVTSACRTKSSANLTLSSFVLDAHDPDGCHSRLVEDKVYRREAEGKRLVFVLNKIGTCASP
jgi:hypothetical protein